MKKLRFGSIMLICALLLPLTFIILNGCDKNEFKESSKNSGEIFVKAKKMLRINKVENNVEKDKIVSTEVTLDNASAKRYIESKKGDLQKYYGIIKKSYEFRNENFENSLYMLSFINEMMNFFTGETFENRCIYLEKIKPNEPAVLPEWLADDIFAPFLSSRDYKAEWEAKSIEEKSKNIRQFLMIAYKDANCERGAP